MLLSTVQKRMLEILRLYGCLKILQLSDFILAEFPGANFDVPLRQLAIADNEIRLFDGFVSVNKALPNFDLLEAVDVMRCFPLKDVQNHEPGREPFLLTFFRDSNEKQLRRYDVCKCGAGREILLAAQLEPLNDKYRTFIIMLDSISRQKNLAVPADHCFAVPDGRGYKFYRPKEVCL